MSNKFKQYAEDVVSGKIVAGKLIQCAAQRHLDWFNRDDIYFDEERAYKPVKFINKLKHTEGKFNRKPFILQDWQEFIVYTIFGWYHKDTNTRVVRNVYIEISRKCGKTSFASALGLYGLIADGEQGAEVDVVAPSREQSNIGLKSAKNYAESINKAKILRVLRGNIIFNHTKSIYKTLSSDANFGDGFNPSMAIVDEYHAMKNNDLPDVLISGMGMRTQPLMIYITTAGFNLYSPCKEYRDMCEDILLGIKQDDTIFPFIYELDANDDWTDEKVWKKCCPSLDITVTSDYLRSQVTAAQNNATLETSVKTKNLNMWCQSSEVWISNDIVKRYSKKFELKDIIDLDSVAYVGVDLAAVSDLTVVSALIKKEDIYYFKSWAFLPEDTLDKSPNSQLYKQWRQKGYLLITPGNVTDYDYILNLIMEINDDVQIFKICYDSWNSTQFAIKATEEGLPLVPFSQALGNFNKATKEFERLLLSGHIILDDNPITRWCIQNCTLKFDHNENCKPIKTVAAQKIDIVIAMLEALGGYLMEQTYDYSIDSL